MLTIELSKTKMTSEQIDAPQRIFEPLKPASQEELNALMRLWDTSHGFSSQSRIVASFILGLYDGPNFRFDLSELRSLDDHLNDDCLVALRLDGLRGRSIENHLQGLLGKPCGGCFEELAERWGICRISLSAVFHDRAGFTKLHDE